MSRSKKPAAGAAVVRNLATFRDTVDKSISHPKKIRAALEALKAAEGHEAYELEAEFLRRAPGVGNSNVTAMRPVFAKHIVIARPDGKNDKRFWFADVKVAAKAATIKGARLWTPAEDKP